MDMYEVETKNVKLPNGFYFAPTPNELISHYLLKKIKGLPLPSDIVIIRDAVQLLDPEQHHFDEFPSCLDNEAYYITDKAERKMLEGGSETRTIIKTTTGYWREKKKDFVVTNRRWYSREEIKDIASFGGDDQIIGYKKTFTFFRGKNEKTSWRMDELMVDPEIVPADVRDKAQKMVACKIGVKQPKTPDYGEMEYEIEEDEEEYETEEDEED
ncbi:hypothetical protein POM88_025222 [Heracleum sosnowskyi]|uniref:NAC domain-containing protein n=1 Tax=Heracleum sosnowskyi TaxID=360622 RepID=A0AAD8I5Z5_9APIA|nr:hypothetical protein POM88_025222 [Heracleum sosnowskyi]